MADRKIGLDYLRAAAILLVVVCHFLGPWLGAPHSIAYPLGVLGVEIFFVLSGFLIGGIFLKSVHQAGGQITLALLATFWVRRWLRTVPNYLLFIPVYAVLAGGGRWPTLEILTFTQNFAWPNTTPYGISWSLCVEEWFYLLFPVVCLLAFALCRNARTAFLWATVLLFIAPLALRLINGAGLPWDEGVRKVVVFRLDAIMWGVLLAAVYRYRPLGFRSLQTNTVALLGLLVMGASLAWAGVRYATGNGDFTACTMDALIFCAFDLSALLIIPFAVASRGLHSAPDRFAVFTSQWSYSMYLAHIPVMTLMLALAKATSHTSLAWIAWMLLALFAIYAVSAAVYFGFELPILRLRDYWTRHSVGASAEAAVPACAVTGATDVVPVVHGEGIVETSHGSR